MPAQFKWMLLPPETVGERTAAEQLPIIVEGEVPFDKILGLAVTKYPGWEFGIFLPLLPETVFHPPEPQTIKIPHGLEGK